LKRVKKILVIRFSSIGDIVLTTPVIRCLKQQVWGSEIHFLTKAQHEPVVRANPYIDKLWLYDRNFDVLIPQLKSQKFDFIVDLHKNYRSAFVKSHLKVKSASFPKLNVKKWLSVHLKLNLLPHIHIVDRYFMATEKLGIRNDDKGLDYFIPPEDEIDPANLPESHRNGYVAIVIGGKHSTKIFPEEKVAEVCNHLSHPVILIGGPADEDRGEYIVNNTGTTIYNACGKYNLNQSASLIRQAKAVMTNDTGLMHIAAALRKPIVSVWGNTIPEFGMFPYLPGAAPSSLIMEVKGLSCRPCSKLGFDACPKGHFRCMNEIDVGAVAGFLSGEW
jgi:ADP-heptose:LPS heptosyltransferase